MSAFDGMRARLRALLARSLEDRELDEEVRFHLEMEAAKLEREGVPPDEARRLARVRFGGVERMKERTRDERGSRWLEDTLRDARLSVRSLARDPAFSVVAVVTLALGIGAATAMFTLVDGVLLRPLPYPGADRMVAISELTDEGGEIAASYWNFRDWRDASPSFEAMAAYVAPIPLTVLTAGRGVRAVVVEGSADLFDVAGVAPVVGRLPSDGENGPGGPPVAVVSHGFWQDELAGRPLAEGLTLSVRRTVHDVIGVMPPRFGFPDDPDIWLPLDRHVPWSVRGNHVVSVVGRLTPGAALEDGRRELEAAHAGILERFPGEVDSPGVSARPLRDEVVGDAATPLRILLAASGLLLLVACTNVAGTLLARGTSRLSELGVRAALGAGRVRLVRRFLLESLGVAGLGAAGGAGLAYALVALTRGFDPGALPRLQEVSVDGRALAFAAVLAVFTAVASGLLPALSLTRGDLAALVRSGRTGPGRGRRRMWDGLMVAEVAMAVVLLVGGGLMVRSLSAILARDVGYRTEGVVTARLALPGGKYASYEEAAAGLAGIVRSVREAPGVEAAGITLLLDLPGEGSVAGLLRLEDGTRTGDAYAYRVADAGFFEALEILLERGRLFEDPDDAGAPHVAVVNSSMARRLWPGEDPLGRRFSPGGMDPWGDDWLTVIGVVGETLRWDREPGSSPAYYVSLRQRPAFIQFFGGSLVARGREPASLFPTIRERVRAVARDVPVTLDRLEERVARSASDTRLTAFVLTGFASLALLLAAVGVYGVVSYGVALRRREMGIRVALGASPRSVRGEFQRGALRGVALGALVGVGAAAVAAGLLSSLLVDTSRFDPVALAASLAVLGASGWLASWLPARRGTRIDPAGLLREE